MKDRLHWGGSGELGLFFSFGSTQLQHSHMEGLWFWGMGLWDRQPGTQKTAAKTRQCILAKRSEGVAA